MPRVLFLGCNHDQIPYLKAAQDMGFEVVGTDRNEQAPGAALADRFYCTSYSDIDSLVHIWKEEGFSSKDRIFTASSHFAFEGAAGLAERVGVAFPSREAIHTCLDKNRFYRLLSDLKIDVPTTFILDPSSPPSLDLEKTYFVKSDYGKSPRYCYRIIDGKVPPIPDRFDTFYRRRFLVQEGVEGTQYRVNLYAGEAAIFLKLSDRVSLPLPNLGPGHREVIKNLKAVTKKLGLDFFLTKFDLISDTECCYVIDIGLDPPLRQFLLCDHLGIDFPRAYVSFYLMNERKALPEWKQLYRPVLISGSPCNGYKVTAVETKS